ncbi:MAG: hypothetical protein F6K47_44065 [Symploca sp. SIO2E6]|nr:hypothetical protein [Symploca sp. SIO2E6]
MSNKVNHDELVSLNLKVTLGVGFASFFAAMALILFYHRTPKYQETLSFAVTALATSAAVTSTVYALRSLQQNSAGFQLLKIRFF